MKNLEEKVINYIKKRELNMIQDSLNYRGIRENFELIDGTIKRVHSYSFLVSAGEEFEDRIFYIFADTDTNRLELLLTPHFGERIIE